MIFKKLFHPNTQSIEEPGKELPAVSAQTPIKFYGTSWCPDCRRAKQVFASLAVPYEWFDIDTDKDAAALVQKINKGMRSVPTIFFPDGSILVEPSSETLGKKLTGYLPRKE